MAYVAKRLVNPTMLTFTYSGDRWRLNEVTVISGWSLGPVISSAADRWESAGASASLLT